MTKRYVSRLFTVNNVIFMLSPASPGGRHLSCCWLWYVFDGISATSHVAALQTSRTLIFLSQYFGIELYHQVTEKCVKNFINSFCFCLSIYYYCYVNKKCIGSILDFFAAHYFSKMITNLDQAKKQACRPYYSNNGLESLTVHKNLCEHQTYMGKW